MESWPDVCSIFNFEIINSTTCCGCNHHFESNTVQMYVEMDLPSNESSLSESLEDYFCTSNLSAWPCNNCNNICQSEKRTQIGLVTETEFLTMILT